MRTITKTEPPAFTAWKAQTPGPAGTGKGAYDEMPPHVAAAVRKALHDEQCGLDAYTGQQIKLGTYVAPNGRRDGDTFHLEHMWPQVHCDPHEKVDYANMAGCWPGDRTLDPDYGAPYKDKQHWPSPDERGEFVRPATPGTEERFRYDETGEMTPADPADAAAARTIEKINLNEQPLKGNRASAFDSATNFGELSVREAERILRSIERKEQQRSRLRPFSFVQKQALREHIDAARA